MGHSKFQFWFEVSVRDARQTLTLLEDQFRHEFETDGSNFFLFRDFETAHAALVAVEEQMLEVLEHNVEEDQFENA